jgi:hypothetical protein
MRHLAVVFAVAACGDQTAPPVPYVEVALIAPPSRDLDVLFVIDDSINLDMQTSLKNAFPVLLDELAAVDGQLPDLHIGVVTSDLGTNGYADAGPGPNIGSGPGSCSGYGKAGRLVTTSALQGNFISDVAASDGTRTTNYTGTTLASAFSQIASVGAAGCGFEQPLEAMRLALLDPSGEHVGFLRPEARLAVITLQDEDDCSFAHSALLSPDAATLGPLQSFRCTRFGVTCDVGGKTPDEMAVATDKDRCHSNDESPYVAPLDRYRDVLTTVKSDPRDVMFATMAGDPTPVIVELRTPPGGGAMIPALHHSCDYEGRNGLNVADPAVRMVDLASRVRRGSFETVCEPDFTPALHSLGHKVRMLLGDTCLPVPPADDCKVFAQTLTDEHEVSFELVPDAACAGGVRLQVSTPAAADTMLSVRCR